MIETLPARAADAGNTALRRHALRMLAVIEGLVDGYRLLKAGNGQADSTTEVMFGIIQGCEIMGGRLGLAIRITTLSGSALQVLQLLAAATDGIHWTCGGSCGMKQPMMVSMGRPALRVRADLPVIGVSR